MVDPRQLLSADPGPARCEHLQAMMGLAIALALRVSLLEELVGEPAPAKPPPEPSKFEAWAMGAEGLAAYAVVPGLAGGLGVRAERALPPNLAVRVGALGLGGGGGTFDRVPGAFTARPAPAFDP